MARPKKRFHQETEGEIRVILPRGRQVLGFVEIRLGYGKSRVRCTDGRTRICRIPGSRRRDLWVRPDMIVLVEPWEISGEDRGDIIYCYNKNQVEVLKKKGLIKDLVEAEEF